MRVITSPGILLRSHPYSESSRILRFLTPEMGIVSLLGKGSAKRGATRGDAIETFSEGAVTFSPRPDRDLHTLREYQRIGEVGGLGSDLRRFLGASLLAELLLVHALQEGNAALYSWVRHVLTELGGAPEDQLSGWILAGSWRLLAHLGFSPELERCLICGGPVGVGEEDRFDRFDAAGGGLRCAACSEGGGLPRIGPMARRDLAAMLQGEAPVSLVGGTAHLAIVEAFCLHHLAPGRAFKTFGMLRPLIEGAARGR